MNYLLLPLDCVLIVSHSWVVAVELVLFEESCNKVLLHLIHLLTHFNRLPRLVIKGAFAACSISISLCHAHQLTTSKALKPRSFALIFLFVHLSTGAG